MCPQADSAALREKYLMQRQGQLGARMFEYEKAFASAQPFDAHEGW